ncbi:MAG: alkaline phosphatase [Bacteroidetes bacterium]|nr:alkaline phosphatase [Bacteroidota bacterium]
MIGDGMGLTQITAGMYMNGNKLNLEQFSVVGLHKPYAFNDLITDSAAGATAFSAGVKTYNGAIGVNADTAHVQTILEEAEANGLNTGVIATSEITHATPASFFAHQPSRNQHEDIAADMLKTGVDLFIGGGKKYFDQRENDERNLMEELRKSGYVIADYFHQDFDDSLKMDPQFNFGYFTANDKPLPVAAGRDYLPYASKRAVEFLDQRNPDSGFFLMIEGSQIDWGGHANDSDYIVTEMIDFDQAIGEVLKFAEADGNTLVIVTADHETGGYAINPGSSMDTIIAGFTSGYHTGTLIPVFAYGPGSELFNGIYENTAIFDKMRLAFGFDKNEVN